MCPSYEIIVQTMQTILPVRSNSQQLPFVVVSDSKLWNGCCRDLVRGRKRAVEPGKMSRNVSRSHVDRPADDCHVSIVMYQCPDPAIVI
jgi:hypothetical protein